MANENRSAQRGADKPKRNGWRVFGRVIGTIVLVGVLMMAHIFIPSQGSALETEVDDDNEF